jgi:hypothetical protein
LHFNVSKVSSVKATGYQSGAFALMTQTMRTQSAKSSPRNRHPEAPAPGDEVLYVDLSRERLEYLYEQAS